MTRDEDLVVGMRGPFLTSVFFTLTALFMHQCEEENSVAAWQNKPRISVLYLNSHFTLHTSRLQLKPLEMRSAVLLCLPPRVGMPGANDLFIWHTISPVREARERAKGRESSVSRAEGNEECPTHFRMMFRRDSSRLRLTQTTWQSSCK